MVIGWLCLLACTVAVTLIWPVARWGLHGNGHVRAMGFWTCLTSVIVCGVALSMQSVIRPFSPELAPVWIAGAVLGVAYSIGFYILIMRCLQTGPTGPTVTVNNSAMICGVLFGVVWLDPHVPNLWIILGAAGTLLAMTLVGLGKTPAQDASLPPANAVPPITARWKLFLMLGGAFSGLSFMSQAYIGIFHATVQKGQLFAAVGFGLAGVILLASMPRQWGRLWSWREIIGGAGVGVLNTVNIPLTMKAYACFAPEIVLPVTVVTPIALNLLIARVLWGERLSRVVWGGCTLAIISVAVIAYGSKMK